MQFQCFVSPLVKALQYQLSVCTSSTTRTAGGACTKCAGERANLNLGAQYGPAGVYVVAVSVFAEVFCVLVAVS